MWYLFQKCSASKFESLAIVNKLNFQRFSHCAQLMISYSLFHFSLSAVLFYECTLLNQQRESSLIYRNQNLTKKDFNVRSRDRRSRVNRSSRIAVDDAAISDLLLHFLRSLQKIRKKNQNLLQKARNSENNLLQWVSQSVERNCESWWSFQHIEDISAEHLNQQAIKRTVCATIERIVQNLYKHYWFNREKTSRNQRRKSEI